LGLPLLVCVFVVAFFFVTQPNELGMGEIKFSGQVLPTMKKVVYGIDIKRVMRSKLVLGVADGWLSADGSVIYRALDLKVGLVPPRGAPQASQA